MREQEFCFTQLITVNSLQLYPRLGSGFQSNARFRFCACSLKFLIMLQALTNQNKHCFLGKSRAKSDFSCACQRYKFNQNYNKILERDWLLAAQFEH